MARRGLSGETSAHSWSASWLSDVAWLARSSKVARSVRSLAAGMGTTLPASTTSSGPSTRNSITGLDPFVLIRITPPDGSRSGHRFLDSVRRVGAQLVGLAGAEAGVLVHGQQP